MIIFKIRIVCMQFFSYTVIRKLLFCTEFLKIKKNPASPILTIKNWSPQKQGCYIEIVILLSNHFLKTKSNKKFILRFCYGYNVKTIIVYYSHISQISNTVSVNICYNVALYKIINIVIS